MSDRKVISAIKKAMPAVVSILISRHLEDIEKETTAGTGPHPKGTAGGKKVKIPDEYVDIHGMVQVGGGSGFIVDSSGLILTNKHVISEPGARYSVVLNDERKLPARVLSRDPINDVAILKIEAEDLPCLKLGNARKLELGQTVIAIGNALGIFKNTVSTGIVSGLSRSVSARDGARSPVQELRGLIQTDAAINPGNSGGPLIDIKGKAIGINAAIIYGAENIGLAIPINAAERDLIDVKKYGRIRRPYLGVRYVTIDDNMRDKMELPVNHGAYVTHEGPFDHAVVPGSPAEQIGIRECDIILELNSQKIDADHTIQDCLDELSVGESIRMRVLRNKKEFDLETTLSERK